MHDAAVTANTLACVYWVLSNDGTAAELRKRPGLARAVAALHALVGAAVWGHRIPVDAGFDLNAAAVWFEEKEGGGPDEWGGDVESGIIFYCLGGRVGEAASGVQRPQLAKAVGDAVNTVLARLENVRTPQGVIVGALPERAGIFGEVELETRGTGAKRVAPCWISEWRVECATL